MKRTALFLAVLAALLVAPKGDTTAEGRRTLTGRYSWNQGSSGDLEAIFTPDGGGTWSVAFHFSFRGQGHVYTGTAEGSLSGGSLRGRVRNENGRRAFTFRGTFSDGTFHGSHAEIEDGREQSTGTLTLRE